MAEKLWMSCDRLFGALPYEILESDIKKQMRKCLTTSKHNSGTKVKQHVSLVFYSIQEQECLQNG